MSQFVLRADILCPMSMCMFRAELEAMQTELLEVKQLYVEMCQQKDRLEADLNSLQDRQDKLLQVSVMSDTFYKFSFKHKLMVKNNFVKQNIAVCSAQTDTYFVKKNQPISISKIIWLPWLWSYKLLIVSHTFFLQRQNTQ